MEPSITIRQLERAGDAYCNLGLYQVDAAAKVASYTKAADYFNLSLNVDNSNNAINS